MFKSSVSCIVVGECVVQSSDFHTACKENQFFERISLQVCSYLLTELNMYAIIRRILCANCKYGYGLF
jgi:hypothetical protein